MSWPERIAEAGPVQCVHASSPGMLPAPRATWAYELQAPNRAALRSNAASARHILSCVLYPSTAIPQRPIHH